VNIAKAGRAIPVKWRLTDADGVGVGPDGLEGPITVTSSTATCPNETANVVLSTDNLTSGLKYLGDGNWQYVWKSSTSWRGCRTFSIDVDGQIYTADFQFR
jgi:hypothetical protein